MTKLQAVQEMLRRCGRRPGPALQTGSPSDMGEAERMLDEEDLDVQAIGWEYNTRFNVELSPILYTFDNATYVDSNRTLAQVGSFADATVGQTLEIAGAEYIVEALNSDDMVTLATNLTGGDATGVTGAATNNKIVAPAHAISFDTDAADEWRDFTQQGRRLYDNTNNTDLFEKSVRVTYVEKMEFGCIPYEVRKFIMLRAALKAARFWQYSNGGVERDMLIAQGRAFERNTKDMKKNIHDTRDGRALRLNRTSRAFFRNGN